MYTWGIKYITTQKAVGKAKIDKITIFQNGVALAAAASAIAEAEQVPSVLMMASFSFASQNNSRC